jgi:bifunctional non-homologous end joining protein LigD
MAKRLGSRYEPGRRSSAWRKLKVRQRQEFVVGGWTPGEGSRANHLGALILGYYEGPQLRFAGKVGSGFTQTELQRLGQLLSTLETDECPFDPCPPRRGSLRSARWVRPETVVEVAFTEWSREGHVRHPSYIGQRDDKIARDVVREEPTS